MIEVLAQVVRQSEGIKSITYQGTSLTLLLYADDIYFSIQDLRSSLQTLNHILIKFEEISGYKVNNAKSLILGMNLSQQEKIAIQQLLNNPWNSQVKYLGVKITASLKLKELILLNISPLLSEIQNCFMQWYALGISWFGRVQAVKIKILPNLVFIFHALILLIPVKTPHLIQSEITKFIWASKRPWI